MAPSIWYNGHSFETYNSDTLRVSIVYGRG